MTGSLLDTLSYHSDGEKHKLFIAEYQGDPLYPA
jgi:hypothetical protein